METEGAGEARLEVALAQAIINEVKYGSETSQLAEVSLLAAFQNRMVGKRLVHALLLLMPGLKYFSIGALLKDGVVVRTSNLAVEGPVEIEPRTLRGSAARVAARKQTTFHTKKRSDEDTGVKYYELQEAWDVAKATSVLTVPIPAVRTYESASIADTTPPLEETASDPASHVCPVLHSLNGAVGVVTLGLATEDIDLDGRQGKAFQGIAQSLSPFLAYYAAPVLKQLQQQIRSVANANAASVARFKARHAVDTDHVHAHVSHKRRSTDGSEGSHVAENAVSPFLAAAYSSDLKRRSDGPAADSEAQSVPRAEPAQKRPSAQPLRQTPNPFAQVATVAFSESCAESPPRNSQPAMRMSGGGEPQQQPVSPFAAAAQDSGRLFSSHADAAIAASQFVEKAVAPEQPSAAQRNPGDSFSIESHRSARDMGADYAFDDGGSSQESIACPQDSQGASSNGEANSNAMHQQRTDAGSLLDTAYAFKRRPILSSTHVRRYSTSTFLQGVLHTPKAHFSHVSNMAEVTEEKSGEMQQQAQPVVVDDFSYASLTHQINRRALSTPQESNPAGPLPVGDAQQQINPHASCPGPMLFDLPFSSMPLLDAAAQASAAATHIALQGHFSKDGLQQGVMFGRAPAISPASAVVRSTSFQAALPLPVGASRLSQQIQATQPAFDKKGGPLMKTSACEAGTGLQQVGHHSDHVDSSPSKTREAVETAKHAQRLIQQHPFWMTFSEPLVEEEFNVWFGQKCSKMDTIFMLVATIYITQLLFFTWALADQQAEKWPLFGYIMVPVLILQHGDTSWYLKNRVSILGCIRLLMLGFLALVVPYIVHSHPGASTRWMDMSGLGPLVVVPLGLLVRFKVHVVLHAISCASLVVQGLQTCMAEPQAAKYPCQMASMQRLVVATCAPTAVLYLAELRARAVYLQTAKS